MGDRYRRIMFLLALVAVLAPSGAGADNRPRVASPADPIRGTQPKVVKIYGAGGLRGMEAYQSGLLISPDGHVLTAWSAVLDTDYVTVTLDDGRKLQGKLLGADPRLEVAVLKLDAAGLPCFDLGQAVEVDCGTRVLAFSNLFGVATGDEPASVQHGVVSVKTRLDARRGVFETPYDGPVYVLDAVTNNPGAAGGVVVTWRGEPVAMLGKEVRNAQNGTWLNYAIPLVELRESVEKIRKGEVVAREEETEKKPERTLTLARLGIVLVPDVVRRTPPYVDHLHADSPAASAGIRPDDLILLANDRLVPSQALLRAELEYIDYEDPIKLSVLRGNELLEFELQARAEQQPPP